jgi:hypothetical protein
MLRKLLALLVLVTGLAAAGSPVQAQIFDVGSARAAESVSLACGTQVAQRAARYVDLLRVDRDEPLPKVCPRPPRIVLIVPTVMLQADRARE